MRTTRLVAASWTATATGYAVRSLRRIGNVMKPVIYQIVVRYFGNTNTTNRKDGTIEVNGCGKFADITETALQALKNLGVTHIWLTGCLRQATLTGYPDLGLPADDPDVVLENYVDDTHGFMRIEIGDDLITARYFAVPRLHEPPETPPRVADLFQLQFTANKLAR